MVFFELRLSKQGVDEWRRLERGVGEVKRTVNDVLTQPPHVHCAWAADGELEASVEEEEEEE